MDIIWSKYKLEKTNSHLISMNGVKVVLKSKFTIFWHISKSTFYRKHIKFVGTLIITIKNQLVFFVFLKMQWLFFFSFLKKWWQRGHFETVFCSIFPSKFTIFWHISGISFDRKCIKIIDILFFIMKNWQCFSFFC